MTLIRQVPPWGWIIVTAVAGLGVLTYHRYATDDDDEDWTDPKETQAPTVASFPPVPGSNGVGTGRSQPVRARAYPGSLTDSAFSVIREL